ncbi:Protein YzbB [Citrifermentans bremense]|uniref:Protein YzbB n=1 Tax=Citrifermentans bremense TaxID=60035 RepID=A0A6S6LY17_9BACT|nr:Protein YzbB [Citrifermentans bremense]
MRLFRVLPYLLSLSLMLILIFPAPSNGALVKTGAEVLSEQDFLPLKGKNFALVTNHSALVGEVHLLDLMKKKGIMPTVIFTPEHGLKGTAEDGVQLADDTSGGVPVISLYGAVKQPRPEDLKGIDLVVFDIQDAGVRFYTYISTMGLAMQAAAREGIPFMVLDRPNPLGGEYVGGFVRDGLPASFTSLYPVPIAHGMTVGELAGMIKGEAMLPGLTQLDLKVVRMQGWQRSMRWPDTGLLWVATSPNLASFESVLLYPGTGLLEGTSASEGRGSTIPFQLAGWPGIDPLALAARLNSEQLRGVHFEPVQFTPLRMPGVSSAPKYRDREVGGVRIDITDYRKVSPVETGVAVLSALHALVPEPVRPSFFRGGFDDMAGSAELRKAVERGESAQAIAASWNAELSRFLALREGYLLYGE